MARFRRTVADKKLSTVTKGEMRVVRVEGRRKQTRQADVVGFNSCAATSHDPARLIGTAVTDALDPVKAPSRGRTLSDMTPEERAKMLALYKK